MIRPTPATCPRCDLMLDRIARLVIGLRHLVATVHHVERHGGAYGWTRCKILTCVTVRDLIANLPQPEGPHDPA